jgi:hypothetical protein
VGWSKQRHSICTPEVFNSCVEKFVEKAKEERVPREKQ